MQNEGKLFQSSYPKSFRDLVGKNGAITAQGEQQKKLHSIASNMMRLEKLKFHFLQEIQIVIRHTLNNLKDNQIICLQDICRKVIILSPLKFVVTFLLNGYKVHNTICNTFLSETLVHVLAIISVA